MIHPDKLLVAGAAGFTGFHVAYRLLRDGFNLVGLTEALEGRQRHGCGAKS